MNKESLLSCRKMNKVFGPTKALIDVDFDIFSGKINGLIGENGSGKSTLTSIIAGAQRANSGCMQFKGKVYNPKNMLEAQAAGVAMIVQESGVLYGEDVASNIFVGNIRSFSRKGFIDIKRMHEEGDKILKQIGVDTFDSYTNINNLNFEERKIVEIARAMYLKPEILIVDETTTALAANGRKILYGIMEEMKQNNKAVVFISHDLDELKELCDNVTVLRDGERVASFEGDDLILENMRVSMVGRQLDENYFRSDYDYSCGEEVLLDVENVTAWNGAVLNFSIKLHKGEIVGLGGLAGCGMHEVGQIVFGLSKPITGRVLHTATGKQISSPNDGIKFKLGYVAKDRDSESLILNASILDNIALPNLKRIRKGIHLSPKLEKELVKVQIDNLKIKCVSEKQFCSELSGGNKQKVAFSKWIAADCDILILDCPTRGVDIGVKATMYKLIYELKKQGKGILMISEELSELIGMSDRMIIMKDGQISKEFFRSPTLTDTQIIEYII